MILAHAKSVNVWQTRISKIDASYFLYVILHEKVRDIIQNVRK